MALKIPKARDAAKLSKMPLKWRHLDFSSQGKSVLVHSNKTISQVTYCILRLPASIHCSLHLYLGHPPLKMSYWLACVPYFRIKDVSSESDLSALPCLCGHTHKLFLYLHIHTLHCLSKIFFSHDEATDVLNLISKAWVVEDTGQTQWSSFIWVSIFFFF